MELLSWRRHLDPTPQQECSESHTHTHTAPSHFPPETASPPPLRALVWLPRPATTSLCSLPIAILPTEPGSCWHFSQQHGWKQGRPTYLFYKFIQYEITDRKCYRVCLWLGFHMHVEKSETNIPLSNFIKLFSSISDWGGILSSRAFHEPTYKAETDSQAQRTDLWLPRRRWMGEGWLESLGLLDANWLIWNG